MFRWLAVVLAAVVTFSVAAFADDARSDIPPLNPPLKTLWRCEVKAQIDSISANGCTALFGTMDTYGAVDITNGKLLWEKTVPEGAYSVEVESDGKTLYAAIGKYKLLACNPATGKLLWSLPQRCLSASMTAYQGLLFCSLRGGVLEAIDTNTHRSVWSCDLYKGTRTELANRFGWEAKPLIYANRLYVGAYSRRILCFEPGTGKQLWEHVFSASAGETDCPLDITADGRQLYYVMPNDVGALDIETGKLIWHNTAIENPVRVLPVGDKVFFSNESGMICAFTAQDGRQIWSREITPNDYDIVSPPIAHYDLLLMSVNSKIIALKAATGEHAWEWDTQEELHRKPLILLKDGFLATASEGGDTVSGSFVRLVLGDPQRKQLTADDKKKLAETLVSKIDSLSSKERKLFISLGEDAAGALLPVFKERAEIYDKDPHMEGKIPTDAQEKASNEFYIAAQMLQEVMTGDQTSEMLRMIDDYKDDWVRRWITEIITRRGDVSLAAPVFFRMYASGQADSLGEDAEDIIWSSPTPEVTQYLTRILKDPKADSEARRDAYLNVARSGTDAAADAVLSVTNTERTIPPITQLMEVDKLCTKVAKPGIECDHPACNSWIKLIAKKADKKGVLWGLITCAVIGTPDDLWIVQYNGKQWTSPQFTGLTRKELGKADWFTKFVGNPTLAKDSDRDGWTDIVEKRLGTNPNNPDSDGDGLVDSSDMNPLAAPRELTGEEQILQTAFGAMQQFSDSACTPCLITLPKGMKPFEMNGWGWVTIAMANRNNTPLSKVAGKGLGSICFALPRHDFAGKSIHSRTGDQPILFNADHTEALVQLCTIYHPLAGTGFDIRLRKIRGRWFVVKAAMAWIS